MPRRPKDIGTEAETWAVGYIKPRGWPGIERRNLNGGRDKGDLNWGNPKLVGEVKADQGLNFPEFLRQTEKERVNAGAAVGVCIIKPPGVGRQRMHLWWMLMSSGTYDALSAIAAMRWSNFGVHWRDDDDRPKRTAGVSRTFKPGLILDCAQRDILALPGTPLKPGAKRVSRTGWDMRFLYLPDGLELLRAAGLATKEDSNAVQA